MKNEEIHARSADGVYQILISRAAKRNALTEAMYGALVGHLQVADADQAVRVVYLRSDSGHFCAGNDLSEFVGKSLGPDSTILKFLKTIALLRKPIVCAVGGAVVGIGATLLLHCDVVYAAGDSKFSLPFIKLGLTPEGASTLLLEKRVGTARAHEWLLTGRAVLADEALTAGLVSRTFDDIEATWMAAETVAVEMAKRSAAVLLQTKSLLKSSGLDQTIATIDGEAEVFAAALATEETQAALQAFLKPRA